MTDRCGDGIGSVVNDEECGRVLRQHEAEDVLKHRCSCRWGVKKGWGGQRCKGVSTSRTGKETHIRRHIHTEATLTRKIMMAVPDRFNDRFNQLAPSAYVGAMCLGIAAEVWNRDTLLDRNKGAAFSARVSIGGCRHMTPLLRFHASRPQASTSRLRAARYEHCVRTLYLADRFGNAGTIRLPLRLATASSAAIFVWCWMGTRMD